MTIPYTLVLASLFCISLQQSHAQNFKNGDFTKGISGWSGHSFKVVDDPFKPGNKVLAVEVTKKSGAFFHQEVAVKSEAMVTVSFDVTPSVDYAGEGYAVVLTRTDGWFVTTDYPAPVKAARHIEFKFKVDKGQRQTDFSVRVKGFVGNLYFDNFTITP